jgi:glycosyltransferase involved in cell wall biosynthesis
MKLLFIGAININQSPKGGEEYKNQLIFEKIHVVDNNKSYVDTHNWKTKPKILLRLIFKLFFNNWDSILLSTSSQSAYNLILLIHLFKPKLLNKLTYLVVGGYFPEGVKNKVFKWEKYSELKCIIVQGDILKKRLLDYSKLNNVKVVPNFKKFTNSISIELISVTKFKFVFIGRISKAKGIMEIIEATNILKKENPILDFQVDLFGPSEEKVEFPENLPIKYKGYLDIMNKQKESYNLLSQYSCMLFPTYWKGEGFPGVIIDANIAGLPVIATDWNMNKEVVEEGKTGIIIPIQDSKALAAAMLKMMEDPELVAKMSQNSLNKAQDYHIDKVWPEIEKLIL